MSFWKKTMDYLGLGPDDAYDDYDDQVEPEPPSRSSRSSSGERIAGRSVLRQGQLADGVRRDRHPCRARRVRASRRATSSRRPPGARPATTRGCTPGRRSGRRRLASSTSPGRAGDGAPAPLRPGAGAGRQVQGRAVGDPQPGGHRTRRRPPPDRLRQRRVLLARRVDGEGGHRRLPAQAGAATGSTGSTTTRVEADATEPPTDPGHAVQGVPARATTRREVDAFVEEVAAALEAAQNEATAMEARARAAVARLQELSQQAPDGAAAPSDPPSRSSPRSTRPRRSAAPCSSPSAPPT